MKQPNFFDLGDTVYGANSDESVLRGTVRRVTIDMINTSPLSQDQVRPKTLVKYEVKSLRQDGTTWFDQDRTFGSASEAFQGVRDARPVLAPDHV